MYDGKLYAERFTHDGFFHGTTEEQKRNEVHISMQMNTDGVAIFKSSKFDIWPIYMTVNELPPHMRYKIYLYYLVYYKFYFILTLQFYTVFLLKILQ